MRTSLARLEEGGNTEPRQTSPTSCGGRTHDGQLAQRGGSAHPRVKASGRDQMPFHTDQLQRSEGNAAGMLWAGLGGVAHVCLDAATAQGLPQHRHHQVIGRGVLREGR